MHKIPPPKPLQPLISSATNAAHDAPDELSEPSKPAVSKRSVWKFNQFCVCMQFFIYI